MKPNRMDLVVIKMQALPRTVLDLQFLVGPVGVDVK
jgi:hypothetical protein